MAPRINELLDELLNTLQLYADPGFYSACSFSFDPPTGGFDQDFSHDEQYGRPMPGKAAREMLGRMTEISEDPLYAALLAELEAVQNRERALHRTLTAFADANYLKAHEVLGRPEGKGWEYKATHGLFAEAEFNAHKTANQALGAHFGIYKALEIAATGSKI